jgi:hypothetical protein
MVYSKLNPAVVIKESREIEKEDIGHSSWIYALDVFPNITISVVLGKPNYIFADKNVIYLPIYAISGTKVRMQIGVFEIKSERVVQHFREGELDISKLTPPLLYAFSTETYIQKLNADPNQYKIPLAKIAPIAEEPEPEDQPVSEEDRRFQVHVPIQKVSEEKQVINRTLENGIFIVDAEAPLPPTLPEESEADATKLRKEYRESARNTWIEKHLKNNQYRIEAVPGDGDCYFTCVKNAYAKIGRKISVDKLRAILANEATDGLFQDRRNFYLHYETIIQRIQSKMNGIQKRLKTLQKETKSVELSSAEKTKIIEKAKEDKDAFEVLKEERKAVEKSQNEDIGYMKGLETIDDFRRYVMTQSFWADEWAISTLERVLNYKTIIFSEQAYDEGAVDNVLKCGIVSAEIQTKGVFTPEFYIMVSYSGDHYNVITYRDKPIFQFTELPHDVKILVLNKCLEKNSGPYYLIQDFRNYKTRFGIDAEEGRPEEYDDEDGSGELYDASIKFIISRRGPNEKNKPGKIDGESVPKNQEVAFLPLSKISEWRKKLDDAWMGTDIRIRNKMWASITHYLEGAKYRVGHPDVYEQFSVESQNPTARDITLAKSHKSIVLGEGVKKSAIKPDVDYALGRDVEERDLALRAKFKDNVEMSRLLLATKNALILRKEVYGEPAQPDTQLMRIRKELESEEA